MQLVSDTRIYSVFVMGEDLAENDGDEGDLEHRWNDWVERWRIFGYEPSEEPISWNDETATYQMTPMEAE